MTLLTGMDVNLPEQLEYSTDYNPTMPKSILDFEKKYVKGKIEHGICVRADGTILEQRKGGKGSVKTSVWALNASEVFSHIHPRDEKSGVIGGTFSVDDMNGFLKYGANTYRAAAGEGTYSITKGATLASDVQLRAEMFKAYRAWDTTAKARLEGFAKQEKSTYEAQKASFYQSYKSGNITYEEYTTQAHTAYDKYSTAVTRANNQYLIDGHKWFLANQKKYDYKYGLLKA